MGCCGQKSQTTEYEATVRATGQSYRFATAAEMRAGMNKMLPAGSEGQYTFRIVPKK